MKQITFMVSILVGMLCSISAIAAPAAPPETLSLADLANRSDRWPASVTLQKDFHFANGAFLHQGDKAHVAGFNGTQVQLVGAGNVRFIATADDCALLDAANTAWSALTPGQRAVAPDSLADDLSLWPVKVTTAAAINSPYGKLAAGTEVGLIGVSANGVTFAWPNSHNRLNVGFDLTDVIARARKLVLIDPSKRPSRIAAALAPLLVDRDGKPYRDEHLDDKQIFAFYFGANWCAPCHAFSPDFVKFASAALPAHSELAIVMMSNDDQPAQTLAYMQEEQMPFPVVQQKDLLASSLLNSYAAKMIPHLIVVDRFGKVLASNDDKNGNRADPKDTIDALKKLLTAPTTVPAMQP